MWINKLLRLRYTPLFETSIPSNARWQLETESLRHKFSEYKNLLRRELFLYLSGFKKLELAIIPQNTRRILWLAPSIKNIGDAIMAFSARILLANQYQLDVLLDKKVYELFAKDKFFNRIFVNPAAIDATQYDLIILDSVKSITLKLKKRYFKSIQYCHFRGHFDGVEFNWLLFSYHRINAMLGAPYTQEQLDTMARPYLYPNASKIDPHQLVVAIGGEDVKRRVYAKWDVVIEKLCASIPQIKVVLIGNANASEDASRLVARFGTKVDNQVDCLSLSATAQLIASSSYFLGCDGGLMHIAIAYELSGVALFGHFEPQYRLPVHGRIAGLFAATVNDIAPQQVVDSFTENFS